MASGITISDACLTAYEQLRTGKPQKIKYIILQVSADLSEIVVEKTSNDPAYETFLQDLPQDQCKWAIYDFTYDVEGSERTKIILISWTPDDAKIKQKMIYASSLSALKAKLGSGGIAGEVQGTDYSEVAYETIRSKFRN